MNKFVIVFLTGIMQTGCDVQRLCYALFAMLIVVVGVVFYNTDCYQLGVCVSKTLPPVDNFVGREEDIRNITSYLDFTTSDVQVVHIVGPPGFGKSTLAKKIGEIILTKRVNVHYVDVRQEMVEDVDTLSEKIMLSMVEFLHNRVTARDSKVMLNKVYSNTLIVLDNCDELIEVASKDFFRIIKSVISKNKHVRFLITSQKWEIDIGNFRLHAIYNLSSKSALELLGRVAPSLTHDQKTQIASLTGNVPLALDVVGAIFKFPDAPSAEDVIQDLRDRPLQTLSPVELHSKVATCIDLAYSYLTQELKDWGFRFSHFPGSFDKVSAVFDVFIYDNESMVDELVQRSLLQTSHHRRRLYFHQLIRKFFLSKPEPYGKTGYSVPFNSWFQIYVANILYYIIYD